jgi:hypothetical protein
MKTYTVKKFNTDQKTPLQPSTIPNFQGGFEKMQKSSVLLKICVSVRKIKGFFGDGMSCSEFFGEGGQFNLGNFPSGFL